MRIGSSMHTMEQNWVPYTDLVSHWEKRNRVVESSDISISVESTNWDGCIPYTSRIPCCIFDDDRQELNVRNGIPKAVFVSQPVEKRHPFANLPRNSEPKDHLLTKEGFTVSWRGAGADAWLTAWTMAMHPDVQWFRMPEITRSRREGLRRVVVALDTPWGEEWWNQNVAEHTPLRRTEVQRNMMASKPEWAMWKPLNEKRVFICEHNGWKFNCLRAGLPVEWHVLLDWSRVQLWIWRESDREVDIVMGSWAVSNWKPIIHLQWYEEGQWGLWSHPDELGVMNVDRYQWIRQIMVQCGSHDMQVFGETTRVYSEEESDTMIDIDVDDEDKLEPVRSHPKISWDAYREIKRGTLPWLQFWAEYWGLPVEERSNKTGKLVKRKKSDLEDALQGYRCEAP